MTITSIERLSNYQWYYDDIFLIININILCCLITKYKIVHEQDLDRLISKKVKFLPSSNNVNL